MIQLHGIRTFSKVCQIHGTGSLDISAAPRFSFCCFVLGDQGNSPYWISYLTVGLFLLICNIWVFVKYLAGILYI